MNNYFYCPTCGFDYTAPVERGYFGEQVYSMILSNPIDGRQVDYLMHCPRCNAHTCGVIRLTNPNWVEARSIIEYCLQLPSLKNVSD